jgi:hypothetical protein
MPPDRRGFWGWRLLLNVGQPPRVKSRSFTRRLCGRSAAAQVGEVIQASQLASRSLAIATNEPWVRWLDTPDHVVALVDQAGDTHSMSIRTRSRRVTLRFELPGAVRVVGGSVRVTVGELTMAWPLSSFPSMSQMTRLLANSSRPSSISQRMPSRTAASGSS